MTAGNTATERVLRRLRMRDLRIITTVAALGSMAKAAARLGMSQPAVSQAVAGLEAALDVPLFDRTTRGVTPTAFGAALAERSDVVLNELDRGIDQIRSLADPAKGELRIGTTQPMSAVAAAAIERLVEAYPGMRFHLVTESTDVLLEGLRRRAIEVAISRMFEPIADPALAADVLFHDELAVIARRGSRWSTRRRVTLRGLARDAWALPPADGYLGRLISRAFTAEGLDPPVPAVTTPSSYALTMLAMTGAFLTMHPGMMLRYPIENPMLVALPVDLRSTRNPVAVIRRSDRALSPIAAVFTDTIRAIARKISQPPSRRTTAL